MQKIAWFDVFSNEPTVLALSPSACLFWRRRGGRDSQYVREQHRFTQLGWDVMIICFLVSASSFCCNCIGSIYSSQWLFTFRVCFRKLTKVANISIRSHLSFYASYLYGCHMNHLCECTVALSMQGPLTFARICTVWPSDCNTSDILWCLYEKLWKCSQYLV